MIDLESAFKKYEDEYLKFDRITNPLSKRPDMHAFMVLDRLVQGDLELISASEHDEFFFGIDCEELAKVITEAQVMELVRCGVRYSDFDCLCMFA